MTLALDTAFDGLLDEDALRARLERVRATEERALVGVAVRERRAYAECGPRVPARGTSGAPPVPRARFSASSHAGRSMLPTGCITKLFTAALATKACADGVLGLDAPIAEVLPAAAELRGVTVRQLLEHRHGLDDSLLAAAPRRRDGRIAPAALVERLRAPPRLAAPGELYSYSNAGAWLAAAALEQARNRRYAALLRRVLDGHRANGSVCPALGGQLAVTLEGLLEFALAHAPEAPDALEAPGALDRGTTDRGTPDRGTPDRGTPDRGTPDRGTLHAAEFDRAASVASYGARRGRSHAAYAPLPGWSPFERGVCLGWKLYGRGWLGHNSVLPRAFALLRVEPRARIALVVASTARPAAVTAARLFGALLPDLASLRVPRAPRGRDNACTDLSRCEGFYRTAALAVRVVLDGAGGLALEIGPKRRLSLRPGTGGVFFTEPPGAEDFPYVQLIDACEAGYRFLWNGRFVLRNSACPPPA